MPKNNRPKIKNKYCAFRISEEEDKIIHETAKHFKSLSQMFLKLVKDEYERINKKNKDNQR